MASRSLAVSVAAVPFRDFCEPGFVLTDYASAAMQRLLGDNRLGEMLLVSACIACGAAAIPIVATYLRDAH